MPEGDTVWRAARALHEGLSGAVLRQAEMRVPRFATAELAGRRVRETTARGKHLLTRLEGGLTLHTHLGMSGAWRLARAGERPAGGPGHEIRVLLATDERVAAGFRLPVVELLRTVEEDAAVGHLGPDLLGPDWDGAEAARRLLAEPVRPVGEALLDQRNLAGVGNVYRAELCFMARLAPWTPVGEVPDVRRLVELAHRLLVVNRDRALRCTTGEPRRDRALWVYGRAGRPCRRCGGLVAVEQQGPADRPRPVYWCPRCQGAPGSGTGGKGT
ncbi:DNA-formamidopyrimidine glycosylase family protein [Streptomyces alkaliterrae]|uniref:DNA-(apurinic or apyrimidinic site) lyase n=1 Tax=Streptomyces alkaliterrae TaxID=2213162 RepID=A0A5P0YMD9_9ACTN|nr:DNA-formamidopyrimidine glycosylase family protein [Streptomyces alkaliterrae]MBB1258582.1 Fpg/Nei family DNA glycosylase [Streptomyces alkaliterrae]MQS00827.1 DNA glycosylase [Streptomyces alkaliterrae]